MSKKKKTKKKTTKKATKKKQEQVEVEEMAAEPSISDNLNSNNNNFQSNQSNNVEINQKIDYLISFVQEAVNTLINTVNSRQAELEKSINNRVVMLESNYNDKLEALDIIDKERVDKINALHGEIESLRSLEDVNENITNLAREQANKVEELMDTVEQQRAELETNNVFEKLIEIEDPKRIEAFVKAYKEMQSIHDQRRQASERVRKELKSSGEMTNLFGGIYQDLKASVPSIMRQFREGGMAEQPQQNQFNPPPPDFSETPEFSQPQNQNSSRKRERLDLNKG